MTDRKYVSFEDIPEPFRRALAYTGSIHVPPGQAKVLFSCHAWYLHDGLLELRGAVIDISDRHEGVVVTARYSTYDRVTFGGGFGYYIRPIEQSDEPGENARG